MFLRTIPLQMLFWRNAIIVRVNLKICGDNQTYVLLFIGLYEHCQHLKDKITVVQREKKEKEDEEGETKAPLTDAHSEQQTHSLQQKLLLWYPSVTGHYHFESASIHSQKIITKLICQA